MVVVKAARRSVKYPAAAGSIFASSAVTASATAVTAAGLYQRCGLAPSAVPVTSAALMTGAFGAEVEARSEAQWS